uniref:Transcription initiation factor IIE subunit beta n=1 Tax=Phlebotomus papatasi TaxID=29031 RepID=A0A1B0DHA9_PHLPP
MDPALLREREAFKKRAIATPTVEKKSRPDGSSQQRDESKKKVRPPSNAPKLDSSKGTRHQDGDDHPLTLEEILDETNQLDIGSGVKNWLQSEALVNNPKIDVIDGNRFAFKPVYRIRDGKSLLKLLKQHDLKGLGGVLLEDVQESLPHCEKALKNRASEIVYITRPIDKKKILFYNDKTANFVVDEEFQKCWRAVTVDAMDDGKIDEYLEKQGIRSMQDHGIKKTVIPKRKKPPNKKRQFKKPRDNEHLADVLETYEDNTLTQKGASASG